MPFIQVLLLLLLLFYLLLVALENPGVIHLPLPFGRGEYIVSIGATITAFLAAGGVYAAILLLPVLIQKHTQYLNEKREKYATQQRLAQSLQARLGAVPRMHNLIAEEMVEAPSVAVMPIIEYTLPEAEKLPVEHVLEVAGPDMKVNLEKPQTASPLEVLISESAPEPVKVDLTRPDDYKRISDDLASSLDEYWWQEDTRATKQEMEEILVQTKMAVALSSFDAKCDFLGFSSTQYDRKYLEATFNEDKPEIGAFARNQKKRTEVSHINENEHRVATIIDEQNKVEAASLRQKPTYQALEVQIENVDRISVAPTPKISLERSQKKSVKTDLVKVDLTRPIRLKRTTKKRKKSAESTFLDTDVAQRTQSVEIEQGSQDSMKADVTAKANVVATIAQDSQKDTPIGQQQQHLSTTDEFDFAAFSFDLSTETLDRLSKNLTSAIEVQEEAKPKTEKRSKQGLIADPERPLQQDEKTEKTKIKSKKELPQEQPDLQEIKAQSNQSKSLPIAQENVIQESVIHKDIAQEKKSSKSKATKSDVAKKGDQTATKAVQLSKKESDQDRSKTVNSKKPKRVRSQQRKSRENKEASLDKSTKGSMDSTETVKQVSAKKASVRQSSSRESEPVVKKDQSTLKASAAQSTEKATEQ